LEEQYEDELVTSHSDENPELGEGGGSTVDLMSDNEGSAVDDLYKKERRLGVRPDENVIYYEEYIPDVDRPVD
jgi:hypothetical protein